MVELEPIRRRADEATAGPWTCERQDDEDGFIYYAIHGGDYEFITNVSEGPDMFSAGRVKANGKFIAHARTDVPMLCDEIERKDAEIAQLKAENGSTKTHNPDERV